MDSALLYIVMALGVSTVLNLFLKRLGVSQIIGYILTGTIIVYAFDLRHMTDSATLEHIGEFGIVFFVEMENTRYSIGIFSRKSV